jgi:hypothetical protein
MKGVRMLVVRTQDLLVEQLRIANLPRLVQAYGGLEGGTRGKTRAGKGAHDFATLMEAGRRKFERD